jgi:AbrB family looped-hinge helix DNA binding protein
MEVVKLGKKGQVTIPRSILKSIGIVDESPMLVEVAGDGSIVLRPAAVYPIDAYTDERIAEFERVSAIPPELEARAEALLRKGKHKK